jgi:hypothetical protein
LRIGVQLFEDLATKVEQTDLGFQNYLEIVNVHWYAGAANALRVYGEKLRKMMDPSVIEIAIEDGEDSVLEYLETRTAFARATLTPR